MKFDLEAELLRDNSKAQRAKIADYIGTDKTRFNELMELFFTAHYRVNQRAAHAMTTIVDGHPELIEPYLERLVMNLYNEGLHDAIKRNTVRVLQFLEIPEELWGHTADICFKYLASMDEAIAIKVFSMTVLEKICHHVPELKNELRILIEDQLPYGSAGFKNRGAKILKRL